MLPYVTTIPIASDVTNNFYQYEATAMGFGSTFDPPTQLSPQLNYVGLKVTSNAICNETFVNTIVDSHLCTDTSSGSTCQGNAGGPLVTRNQNNEWIVIGVGSFRHRDGCTLGHPGRFSNKLINL